MANLTLTSGDTAPQLTMLCASDGVPADLTGATVAVHVRRPDGGVINRAGVLSVTPTDGTVSLAWTTGDLTGVGAYLVEAQVTYSTGEVQTFGMPGFYVREQIA